MAFNKTVVLRYRLELESRRLSSSTINLRLAARSPAGVRGRRHRSSKPGVGRRHPTGERCEEGRCTPRELVERRTGQDASALAKSGHVLSLIGVARNLINSDDRLDQKDFARLDGWQGVGVLETSEVATAWPSPFSEIWEVNLLDRAGAALGAGGRGAGGFAFVVFCLLVFGAIYCKDCLRAGCETPFGKFFLETKGRSRTPERKKQLK